MMEVILSNWWFFDRKQSLRFNKLLKGQKPMLGCSYCHWLSMFGIAMIHRNHHCRRSDLACWKIWKHCCFVILSCSQICRGIPLVNLVARLLQMNEKDCRNHCLRSGGCRILGLASGIAKGNGKIATLRLGFCLFLAPWEYSGIYLASVCRERDHRYLILQRTQACLVAYFFSTLTKMGNIAFHLDS